MAHAKQLLTVALFALAACGAGEGVATYSVAQGVSELEGAILEVDGQTVIRASRTSLDGTILYDAMFLQFDAEGTPTQRIEALRARLSALRLSAGSRPSAKSLRAPSRRSLATFNKTSGYTPKASRFSLPLKRYL